MMKKINKNMTSFAEHLDKQYGKRGTETREQYEQGFEMFKLGVMIQELRKKEGLTQMELAQRCQTTPKYISRIENNANDIKMSTLLRIFNQGLGRKINLSVEQVY
ncbi:MAG: helix-turn-helix domain-containing protein [Marinilabiliaceae bacterium]|nr:helix-turn-helix domain-containing protein [Marinilabiliaceae bacterium]